MKTGSAVTEDITATTPACAHCGTPCADTHIHLQAEGEEARYFCCEGCRAVYEILVAHQMCTYYDLSEKPGKPLSHPELGERFDFLDNPTIIASLLDYADETQCRVTFSIPAMHCSSCIWLLENLYRLREGITFSRVNFTRKELALSYNPRVVSLRQIVEILTSVGYEPHLSLEEAGEHARQESNRSILLKIGVTGFCAGNSMLLSLAEYFGWQMANDVVFRQVFIWLNVALAMPVFFYGASDYLRAAYQSLREKVVSLDVPLALGITTLFVRSLYEVLSQTGPGYWDSLSGLVLFLLVGKWVQGRTYESLSFERSYKSYFPLAATVLRNGKTESVPVGDLRKGDRVRVLNGGLVVADSTLLSPRAWIDYSFVTGESEPVERQAGERIFAGGRQVGPQIELLVQKPVSHSYLTQLWNGEAFAKAKEMPVTRLAAQFSRWFTWFTLSLALLTALYWHWVNPAVMWNAFTAVLMVACPCALSLSMPFTMGTAMTRLGRNGFYVKNPDVVQHLATITHVVFDKTGTITQPGQAKIGYTGTTLTENERGLLATVAAQSAHPLSRRVYAWLSERGVPLVSAPQHLREVQGQGIEAMVEGKAVRLGSAAWTGAETLPASLDSRVFVSVGGVYKGCFSIQSQYRSGLGELMRRLKEKYRVSLLSGDHPVDRETLEPLFGDRMFFERKPEEKLAYIRALQQRSENVLMVGDGLNDAGALRQSNVGLVLTDDINTFFPSCDALLEAAQVSKLDQLIGFCRASVGIVKISFLVSLLYNFVGLSWAVSGHLSPVFAAVLMPVSSLSVVLCGVGITRLYAKRKRL